MASDWGHFYCYVVSLFPLDDMLALSLKQIIDISLNTPKLSSILFGFDSKRADLDTREI